MNYPETLDYLYNSLPMFQHVGSAAYNPSLEKTITLCELLDNPQQKFRSIHIAGTNGKGSTSHMLAAILQEAGYKTGLYTSPHLKDFRERIRINGEMIPENAVVGFVEQNRVHFDEVKPSFFEMGVVMAFDHFAREQVDIAVIEVGMGGRLDSTNVIRPVLSVITNIGFDHVQYLGNTLEKIAAEKAGIIKDSIPVVISQTQAETQHVFEETAAKHHSEIRFADHTWDITREGIQEDRYLHLTVFNRETRISFPLLLDLAGSYQQKNCKGVLESISVLNGLGMQIDTQVIRRALMNVKGKTGLRGRWDMLGTKPFVVADTGHNEDGIREVLNQVAVTPHEKLVWVFGMVNDKDIAGVLRLLPVDAYYIFCQAKIPRALDAYTLQQQAKDKGLQGIVIPSVQEALAHARKIAGENDLVLVGGSTFVVAEVVE